MELSLSHTVHLFNIFREYDGKDNCAQVLAMLSMIAMLLV